MTYKWKCNKCLAEFDESVPMSEYDKFKEETHECPNCGCKVKFERVFEKFDGGIKLSSGMYGTGKGGWNN